MITNNEVEIITISAGELLPEGIKKIHLKPEYEQMLSVIGNTSTAVVKATENFNKTQSQFMDNMLTVSHPTLLRNARQVLAEMNKAKAALREAALNCAEREVEIELKKQELPLEVHPTKQKKIQIEIAKLENSLNSTMPNIEAAIRKVANYSNQFELLMSSWRQQTGKDSFTEKDFEEQEEAYHIAKAFDQALTAARSRSGLIDEGNHIYFAQIGVNGASAQKEITGLLKREQELFDGSREPSHAMIQNFLTAMVNKYKGCASEYAKRKGMSLSSDVALLSGGDCGGACDLVQEIK